MSQTGVVLICFFVVSAATIVAMLVLALAGGEPLPQDVVSARGYALRRWWFGLVAVAAAAAFVVSIPWFPYPSASELVAGRHYKIVAQQYAFTVPESVPAATPIVFDVTAKDVNHGFGIYDPAGNLVAQVQAMPGYVNHLPLKFERMGRYTVRCLEYCGLAHSAMQGGFQVR